MTLVAPAVVMVPTNALAAASAVIVKPRRGLAVKKLVSRLALVAIALLTKSVAFVRLIAVFAEDELAPTTMLLTLAVPFVTLSRPQEFVADVLAVIVFANVNVPLTRNSAVGPATLMMPSSGVVLAVEVPRL